MSDLRIGVIGAGGRGVLAAHAHQPNAGSRIVACCDTDVYELAQECEKIQPYLKHYDAWGKRIDQIVTCPAWNKLKSISAEEGLVSIAYERKHAQYRFVHVQYFMNSISFIYAVSFLKFLLNFVFCVLQSPTSDSQAVHEQSLIRSPLLSSGNDRWCCSLTRGGNS